MKTFTRYDEQWTSALDQVFNLVENLPNDKLKKNYSIEGLKVDEWISVSVWDGGFSSIAWRPLWNNNCRILNRFFKLKNFRFENNKSQLSELTEEMIMQQLKIAKDYDFDAAFISREKKYNALSHYLNQMKTVKWNTPEERYLMYHNGYQQISWTAINDITHIDLEKENHDE